MEFLLPFGVFLYMKTRWVVYASGIFGLSANGPQALLGMLNMAVLEIINIGER